MKRLALLLVMACSSTFFDVRTERDFGDPRPAIERWLAANAPDVKGAQHFCVVGYRVDHQALVHWREGQRLIVWWGGDEDALVLSNRQLSLETDVVATEDEINGSTYLVTRAWVDARLADCAAHGVQLTVGR